MKGWETEQYDRVETVFIAEEKQGISNLELESLD